MTSDETTVPTTTPATALGTPNGLSSGVSVAVKWGLRDSAGNASVQSSADASGTHREEVGEADQDHRLLLDQLGYHVLHGRGTE